MTTPRVTEIPLRMEPVEPDPFIAAPSRAAAPRAVERRRLELVRRAMRVRGGRRPPSARARWHKRPVVT